MVLVKLERHTSKTKNKMSTKITSKQIDLMILIEEKARNTLELK